MCIEAEFMLMQLYWIYAEHNRNMLLIYFYALCININNYTKLHFVYTKHEKIDIIVN